MKYNSGLNQIYQLYFYCLHPWFIILAYFFYLQTYSSFAYSPCWILLLPLMLLWPDFPHFRVAVSHISTWIFICAFPKHHYLFLQPYSSKLLSFFPIRYHDVRFLLNSHRFLHSWHSKLQGNYMMFHYLPLSEVDCTACLLGSVLPPLLWRRMLPRDRPRPDFGEDGRSSGACSEGWEESFWWTCQRSPEFDHLEPLLQEINYECQPMHIHTYIKNAQVQEQWQKCFKS